MRKPSISLTFGWTDGTASSHVGHVMWLLKSLPIVEHHSFEGGDNVIHSMLTVRSHFSIGESTLPVERLIEEAKRVGEKVLAVCDTISVTALIEFSRQATKAGTKPIIGCRL